MTAKPHQLEAVPERYRPMVGPHGKSPWHPSVKATARVLNPLPAPSVCSSCGGDVVIAHHTEVYGREYSEWPWMYRCPACDSSVGMHPFTSIPLGTLADRQLRTLRNNCKQPFELVWRSGLMSRDQAYAALADHLGMPVENCHFGWFDADQCRRALAWSVGQLRSNRT